MMNYPIIETVIFIVLMLSLVYKNYKEKKPVLKMNIYILRNLPLVHQQ